MDSQADNTGRGDALHSPGAILAAERERQGLARSDIAQRLHMSVSQIEALEASDYSRLPRGTFLRGFTRNYARSLGLDAEALVGLLVEDAPRDRAPEIVVPTQNIRFDPLGQRFSSPYVKAAGIAAALAVLGFAATYWWLFIRPQGAPVAPAVKKPAIEAPKAVPPQAEASRAEPVPAEPSVAQPSTTAPAVINAAAPFTAVSAPTYAPPAAVPAPAPAEPARAAAPGEGTIRLAFRGAAWVEITDARGKPLLSRTHAGGSNAEVVGKPPFNVVIGNAPEVRLTYNGRDVDLAPHTRVAVARFTLP